MSVILKTQFPSVSKTPFPKLFVCFQTNIVAENYIYTSEIKTCFLTRIHLVWYQLLQQLNLNVFDRTFTLFGRWLEYMENSSSNTWQVPNAIKKSLDSIQSVICNLPTRKSVLCRLCIYLNSITDVEYILPCTIFPYV